MFTRAGRLLEKFNEWVVAGILKDIFRFAGKRHCSPTHGSS
jgi:hypothetical protein